MLPENPLAALLEQSPVVILDGALATELEARGCDLCDPLWSAKVLMETPELIYQVHSAIRRCRRVLQRAAERSRRIGADRAQR